MCTGGRYSVRSYGGCQGSPSRICVGAAVIQCVCICIYIQNRFCALKLVLNVEETKCMLFSNSKMSPENSVTLWTSQESQITSVSEYKYLGIIINNTLRFGSHINYLRRKHKS